MKKYFISIFAIILLFAFYDCSKNKNESCSDGIKNQDETQVDCGGTCSPCGTCSDGLQNQNETKVDCGGICAACPSCFDGIQNQGESGIDVGGPCSVPSSTNSVVQNTTLNVGGSGWNNPSCGSSNSLTLKGINGSTEVSFTFSPSIATGSYVIVPIIGPQFCSAKVFNAPNQPPGVVWFGKTGIISVTVTPNSIVGAFTGIVCTQLYFNFPTVVLSGTVGCVP